MLVANAPHEDKECVQPASQGVKSNLALYKTSNSIKHPKFSMKERPVSLAVDLPHNNKKLQLNPNTRCMLCTVNYICRLNFAVTDFASRYQGRARIKLNSSSLSSLLHLLDPILLSSTYFYNSMAQGLSTSQTGKQVTLDLVRKI